MKYTSLKQLIKQPCWPQTLEKFMLIDIDRSISIILLCLGTYNIYRWQTVNTIHHMVILK